LDVIFTIVSRNYAAQAATLMEKTQTLTSEEEKTYKKCLRVDGKYAPCHFGLFKIYSEAKKRDAAIIACKNFIKFGTADEFPNETETCEKFLANDSY